MNKILIFLPENLMWLKLIVNFVSLWKENDDTTQVVCDNGAKCLELGRSICMMEREMSG